MKFICILFLMLIFPSNIKAIHEVVDARCTVQVKTMLREESKDFTYRLSKMSVDGDITYIMFFYGLSENIDLVDEKGNKFDRAQVNNLKQGSSLTINLYASSNTYCEGYKITSKTVKVPYYNKYYGTDLCKGYENFSLCSENERIRLNEEEFLNQIKKYNEKSETNDEDDEIIEFDNEKIGFFEKYRDYFFGLIFLVIIVFLIIKIIKNNKNKGIL